MSRERLLVIGADAAGMSAASRARRRRDADDLEIVAFDRGGYSSYSACGIPYLVGGIVTDDSALIARSCVDPHWAGIGADAAAIEQLVADPLLDVVPADPRDEQPRYR